MTEEPVDAETASDALRDVADRGEPATGAPPAVSPEASTIDEVPVSRGAEAPDRPTAQSELDLGVVSTGSTDIDSALHPLESLTERPVADHAEAYEKVLADLTAAMSDSPVASPDEPDDSTG